MFYNFIKISCNCLRGATWSIDKCSVYQFRDNRESSVPLWKPFFRMKGTSAEWHFYISSRKLTAEELIHHARKEWSVETMHWLLDVHFREDSCKIQSRNTKQNMNMLRKFALNIVKNHKAATSSKSALNGIMFQCLINPSKLCSVLHEN